MRPIASAWEAGSGGVNFTLSFSAPSSFWRQAGLAVSTWGGLRGENDFKKERDAYLDCSVSACKTPKGTATILGSQEPGEPGYISSSQCSCNLAKLKRNYPEI